MTDNLHWRDGAVVPSTVAPAIMLVPQAEPSTSPWGDYVGDAIGSFKAVVHRLCWDGNFFSMTNNKGNTPGRPYFQLIVGFYLTLSGFQLFAELNMPIPKQSWSGLS
jgi:hypothetical protein